MKKILIPVFSFGAFLLIALSILSLFNYLIKETPYEDAAEKLEFLIDDVKTLQARQQLNQIAINSNNIQRLTSFCIKYEITPPIRISDMKSCRISALSYYGFPTDEEELKKVAARPLKDELYFSKEIKPYLDKLNKE